MNELRHTGERCSVEEGVFFQNPDQVKMGHDCVIRRGAILNGKSEVCDFGITLGDHVEIAEYAYLYSVTGEIRIADHVFIGPFCLIYGQGGLSIGKNTMISGHTTIVPANHTFQRDDVPVREQILSMKGIFIGQDVWVGANTVILDGVRIGDGSVVGAGSVVTQDVPPGSVACGNPCRTRGKRKKRFAFPWSSKYKDHAMLDHIEKQEQTIKSQARHINNLEGILQQQRILKR